MRTRILLAAFLLGVGLCFVPALGYGEVKHWMYEAKTSLMYFSLLEARVNYMMNNPTGFLNVRLEYDLDGSIGRMARLPEDVDTKGKVIMTIQDNRGGVFSDEAVLLPLECELVLWSVYSYIDFLATDIDTDIVALFLSKEQDLVGYFYQGVFRFWEKSKRPSFKE